MAERRWQGRCAAPGLALGPLVELRAPVSRLAGRAATPARERQRLLAAIAQASAELAGLAAGERGLGAELLEVQIELLADPALIEDALAAIAGGASAEAGWSAGLDAEIETYDAAEDDHFRALASDLVDLRDRVLLALQGGGSGLGPVPAGAIVLARDLPPSRFLALDWRRIAGAALSGGGPKSHVAILARARAIPLVVGLGAGVEAADRAILDADAGLLITAPAAATLAACRRRLAPGARAAAPAAAGRK